MIIKNVFFDLDGTLIDSSKDIVSALQKAYQVVCNQYIEIDFRYIGPPVQEIIDILTPNLDMEIKLKIVESFRLLYDNGIHNQTIMYEGCEDVLNSLINKNIKLFIVTNKPIHPTRKILSIFEIDWLFIDIATPDFISERKMNKSEMIEYLILKHQLVSEETIMIGDTASDIIAAKNNSIMSVGICGGYGDLEELKKSKPDRLINKFYEIKDLNFNYMGV